MFFEYHYYTPSSVSGSSIEFKRHISLVIGRVLNARERREAGGLGVNFLPFRGLHPSLLQVHHLLTTTTTRVRTHEKSIASLPITHSSCTAVSRNYSTMHRMTKPLGVTEHNNYSHHSSNSVIQNTSFFLVMTKLFISTPFCPPWTSHRIVWRDAENR